MLAASLSSKVFQWLVLAERPSTKFFFFLLSSRRLYYYFFLSLTTVRRCERVPALKAGVELGCKRSLINQGGKMNTVDDWTSFAAWRIAAMTMASDGGAAGLHGKFQAVKMSGCWSCYSHNTLLHPEETNIGQRICRAAFNSWKQLMSGNSVVLL